MKRETINELNTLLKGEYMAINAYDRFIGEASDSTAKQELTDIQEEHKRHAEILSQHIKGIGGQPQQGTGIAGVMASATGTLEGLKKRNTEEIIKEAYDGEDKGIAKSEEIVKGDLDEESMKLVNGILSDDHGHLSKMAHMIAKYEDIH
jgi:rubrerythrin